MFFTLIQMFLLICFLLGFTILAPSVGMKKEQIKINILLSGELKCLLGLPRPESLCLPKQVLCATVVDDLTQPHLHYKSCQIAYIALIVAIKEKILAFEENGFLYMHLASKRKSSSSSSVASFEKVK